MQANRRQNRLPHQHRAGEHPRVICHLSRRGEPSGSAQDVFRLGRRVFAPAPQAVFSPSIPQRRGLQGGFPSQFSKYSVFFYSDITRCFAPSHGKGDCRLGSLVGTLRWARFLSDEKSGKESPKAGPSPALWNPPRGTGCPCVLLFAALGLAGSHRWIGNSTEYTCFSEK